MIAETLGRGGVPPSKHSCRVESRSSGLAGRASKEPAAVIQHQLAGRKLRAAPGGPRAAAYWSAAAPDRAEFV